MKEKDRRPIYEPPMARDLADNPARGSSVTPNALCTTGSNPYADCSFGPAPPGTGACAPTGGLPVEPKCQTGSAALIGCIAGSQA